MNPPSYYSSLRPTPPLSGRSTPSSLQNPPNGFKPPPLPNPSSRSNTSTPANDSFAKLVAFSSPQSTSNTGSLKNLSLLEQQKVLQEKREKDESSQKNSLNTSFGSQGGDFLDNLGNHTATPNRIAAPPSYAGTDEYGGQKLSTAINKPFASIEGGLQQHINRIHDNNENDLLSDFDSSSVKISDSSRGVLPHVSGFRALETNGGNTQRPAAVSLSRSSNDTSEHYTADLGDDPFGLGSMGTGAAPQNKRPAVTADDDDILGALGRPVSEFPTPKERELSSGAIQTDEKGPAELAWARLIDMGFSPDKSREALERTESGIDVEAAVGWLLSQAHEDSSRRSRSQRSLANNDNGSENTYTRRDVLRNDSPIGNGPEKGRLQAQIRGDTAQLRRDSRSPVNTDKDSAKSAAEFGTTLLKTANSLWKNGAKKLNQAVSELNSENESAQPKWMREAQVGANSLRSRRLDRQRGDSIDDEERKSPERQTKGKQRNVTDEALLLESGDGRPPRRPPRQQQAVPGMMSSNSSRDQSPVFATLSRERELRQQRSIPMPQIADKKSELRKAVEEQALNAYISPARRKQTAPKALSPEPTLLFDALERDPFPPQTSYTKPSVQSTSRNSSQSPAPSRQLPSTRSIPQISSYVFENCTKNRLEGTSAFKMGDYPRATAKYTTALLTLPPTHPLNIVLLTNRALTHLKTGDPKSSIADSESALAIIGPSRGALETIDLGGTEGSKDMKTFWIKAMTRQAEALEQLERWSDAAAIWKSCVEAGVGGATSIAGRNRCEKATAGPPQTPAILKPTASKKPPTPAPKSSALKLSGDFSRSSSLANPCSQSSAEAVTRLRKANAAAERLDDEKFALADQVSERLAKWRAGKEGNLRALLASLENVLWEGAGWKKVGMSELIMAGKVKVVYMRGIGKVHPDKVNLPLLRLIPKSSVLNRW